MPRPATSLVAAADDAAAKAVRQGAGKAGVTTSALEAELGDLLEQRRRQQTMVMRFQFDRKISKVRAKLEAARKRGKKGGRSAQNRDLLQNDESSLGGGDQESE